MTFQRKTCINCSACGKTETPFMSLLQTIFICVKHFGWEKKRRAAFDWRAERAQCPSRQLHALLSDEPGQTDTLNLTQVQSSAEAHVASTWTELDRIKEKDPEEQKEFAETRLWVMYRWVLCRWELARLLIFFHQSRVHVCVYLPW